MPGTDSPSRAEGRAERRPGQRLRQERASGTQGSRRCGLWKVSHRAWDSLKVSQCVSKHGLSPLLESDRSVKHRRPSSAINNQSAVHLSKNKRARSTFAIEKITIQGALAPPHLNSGGLLETQLRRRDVRNHTRKRGRRGPGARPTPGEDSEVNKAGDAPRLAPPPAGWLRPNPSNARSRLRGATAEGGDPARVSPPSPHSQVSASFPWSDQLNGAGGSAAGLGRAPGQAFPRIGAFGSAFWTRRRPRGVTLQWRVQRVLTGSAEVPRCGLLGARMVPRGRRRRPHSPCTAQPRLGREGARARAELRMRATPGASCPAGSSSSSCRAAAAGPRGELAGKGREVEKRRTGLAGRGGKALSVGYIISKHDVNHKLCLMSTGCKCMQQSKIIPGSGAKEKHLYC
ncbi:PREDICTED: uncharacterized protein LOC106149804 [Chinchilla lanigera]|uniref:uncharacterized protein LOC106149804 n=1 Tax=Chinchilla lanigera TaxID=34839 RepID=UPI000697F399|nr:PREDICTED: uncharacterized protein LOC106149804 [Chinchilla lanigera]